MSQASPPPIRAWALLSALLASCGPVGTPQSADAPAETEIAYSDALATILRNCPQLTEIEGLGRWLGPCEEYDGRTCTASRSSAWVALRDLEYGYGREESWTRQVATVDVSSCEVAVAESSGWNSSAVVEVRWAKSSAASPTGPWWPVPASASTTWTKPVVQDVEVGESCDSVVPMIPWNQQFANPIPGRAESLPPTLVDLPESEASRQAPSPQLPVTGSLAFVPEDQIRWRDSEGLANLGLTNGGRFGGQAIVGFDPNTGVTRVLMDLRPGLNAPSLYLTPIGDGLFLVAMLDGATGIGMLAAASVRTGTVVLLGTSGDHIENDWFIVDAGDPESQPYSLVGEEIAVEVSRWPSDGADLKCTLRYSLSELSRILNH